jgi:hypothetical protein
VLPTTYLKNFLKKKPKIEAHVTEMEVVVENNDGNEKNTTESVKMDEV